MPSTATITAFYSFSANTRARASQVQANFDNFRGHLLPIEPLTITSSDITYDLGSDEHRWRTGYVKTLDFDGATSTASATIDLEQSITSKGPGFIFKIAGTEVARIGNKRKFSSDTSGAIQLTTTGYQAMPNMSVDITCSGAHTVELGFFAPTLETLGAAVILGANTITGHITAFFEFYRNGAAVYYMHLDWPGGVEVKYFEARELIGYDSSAPAGVNTYTIKCRYQGYGSYTLATKQWQGFKMYAEEKINY